MTDTRAAWTAVLGTIAPTTKRTRRTGVVRPEREEQAEVVAWARFMEPRHPALRWLFAVPNAAKRRPKTIAILKSTGLKAGVPDLLLPIPCDAYCGLAIEMKIKGNTPTEAQRAWLSGLALYGWRTTVCWNAREAIDELSTYLLRPGVLKIPANGTHRSMAGKTAGSADG